MDVPARSSLSQKRYTISPVKVAPTFNRLPEEVRRLLRLCDGTRSLRALRKESGLSQLVFGQVMEKLEALGYIEVAMRTTARGAAVEWMTSPPANDASAAFDVTMELPRLEPEPLPPPPASTTLPGLPLVAPPIELLLSDFSLDEEAFFSRTIDHLLEPEERVTSIWPPARPHA